MLYEVITDTLPPYGVPLHLRNAATALMKSQGYGKGYKYSHDFPGHFTEQEYLPEELRQKQYYRPTTEGRESRILERLRALWKRRSY